MKSGDIKEYIEALRHSPKFGPQVVHYRKNSEAFVGYKEMPEFRQEIHTMLAGRGIQ